MKKVATKEFPKLCKNPDCPREKPLTKRTWQKHHAAFMVTGACPRTKVYRTGITKNDIGISAMAKDRAMANMLDNIESDEGELIEMLKGGVLPVKRART